MTVPGGPIGTGLAGRVAGFRVPRFLIVLIGLCLLVAGGFVVAPAHAQVIGIQGGHHLDGNYDGLAARILAAVPAR